jgi:hypothetical protein
MRLLLICLLMTLSQLGAQVNEPPLAKEKERVVLPTSNPARGLAPLTSDDVLSIKDGRLFLEGKPFAEISFNKYDLFWQLYDQLADGKQLDATNALVRAQDKALRNLHELGFKTIRIFALPWGPAGPESYVNPEKRKYLYAALDKTLELCDAHDIRVVWSLTSGSFTETARAGSMAKNKSANSSPTRSPAAAGFSTDILTKP